MTDKPQPKYKVTVLPPAKPRKSDLVMTRVGGTSSASRVAGSHRRPNRFN